MGQKLCWMHAWLPHHAVFRCPSPPVPPGPHCEGVSASLPVWGGFGAESVTACVELESRTTASPPPAAAAKQLCTTKVYPASANHFGAS